MSFICTEFFTSLLFQPKDSWKSELRDFSSKNGYDLNRNGDSGPLLLDVLEGFLKYEVCESSPIINNFLHKQIGNSTNGSICLLNVFSLLG